MSNSTETQQEASGATTDSFVTALVFNAAIFGAELVAFTILRRFFKPIYEPRTYVPPKSKRIASLSPSLLGWIPGVLKSDPEAIIAANGLDAYFFVRFCRMCLKIFGPLWLISWAVLLPVTSVHSRVGNNEKLDLFSFGNVRTDQTERYSAHLVLAWVFTLYILYVLKQELSHFVYKRQLFLISPEHAKSVMASTVLITGIPGPYLSKEKLYNLFKDLPGGVRTVWVNRELGDLPDVYDRQIDACNKLEKAEFALLKAAAKAKAKTAGKKVKTQSDPEKASPDHEVSTKGGNDVYLPQGAERPHHKLGFLGLFGEKVDSIEWTRKEIRETKEILREGREAVWKGEAPWEEKRHVREETAKAQMEAREEGGEDLDHADLENDNGSPTHNDARHDDTASDEKKGSVGIGGKVLGGPTKLVKKVRGNLDLEQGEVKNELEGENAERREGFGRQLGRVGGNVVPVYGAKIAKMGIMDEGEDKKYPKVNSAFVTFNRQIGAHMAAQVLLHSGPYRMTGKYLEIAPSDVIWANLGMDAYAQKVRVAISWALTMGLILLWAFPVAFVGIISNISTVCTTVKWLNWLCHLPGPVTGIIQGILPPVLLAVLFMLLPIVLRMFARFEGIPKYSGLELSLMSRYFIFVVLHGFLIVTLSSGIISSLDGLINNPTSIPTLLASKLPKASTFFLTYVVLQGLSGAAGGFLMIAPLIIYYIKLFILGSTPRSVFGLKYGARNVSWGTLFPNTTLLVVISLAYSIISPIINGLVFLTFFLFYLLYKYLFLWVDQQPESRETGGLFFPKAIQHVFVGLYVQHICLAALFFLVRDENGNPSAVPEGALMIVLIVIVVGVHIVYNQSYGPLYYALPLSLADKTYSAPTREEEEEGQRKPMNEMVKGRDFGEGGTSNGRNGHEKGRKERDEEEEEELGRVRAQEEDVPAYVRPSEEKFGYAHPAVSRPQRIVWVPEDALGLWRGEVLGCRKDGVDAGIGGEGRMNEKGKVDVQGPGPGEEYE